MNVFPVDGNRDLECANGLHNNNNTVEWVWLTIIVHVHVCAKQFHLGNCVYYNYCVQYIQVHVCVWGLLK